MRIVKAAVEPRITKMMIVVNVNQAHRSKCRSVVEVLGAIVTIYHSSIPKTLRRKVYIHFVGVTVSPLRNEYTRGNVIGDKLIIIRYNGHTQPVLID